MDDSKKRKIEDTMDDQTTIVTKREKIDLEPEEKTTKINRENETPGKSTTSSSNQSNSGTASAFGIDDLTKKLKHEIDDIPELDLDDMGATGYMSGIIKNIFPEKTKEEQVEINRKFLLDAEPFKIERLVEDIKSRPEGLLTGFSELDRCLTIPNSAVTLITSSPRQGKSVFLLNIMLNMANLYRDKHFLFFSYEELKREIEIKLINMSSEKAFPVATGEIKSNLARWKHEFRHRDMASLLEQANQSPEFSGLKKFIDISQRIHIIDTNYPLSEIGNSIRSFGNTFQIGAVFIDSLREIGSSFSSSSFSHQQHLKECAATLKRVANDKKLPIIVSSQFLPPTAKGIPEYDNLSPAIINSGETADIYHAARLVIGLQDYSRSKYIGSNTDDTFVSKLFDHKLLKAAKVQENIDQLRAQTVMLARVLLNREGLEPEVELFFDKALLKIRNLRPGDIQQLKKHLV